MASTAMISQLNNNFYHHGFSSLGLLEEVYLTVPISVMFHFYSPLFEPFDERIHQLQSSGLISYWYELESNDRGLKFKASDIGPQVLTMDHVTVGFMVCLVPLVLSLLTFLIELAVFKLKEMFRSLKIILAIRKIFK